MSQVVYPVIKLLTKHMFCRYFLYGEVCLFATELYRPVSAHNGTLVLPTLTHARYDESVSVWLRYLCLFVGMSRLIKYVMHTGRSSSNIAKEKHRFLCL